MQLRKRTRRSKSQPPKHSPAVELLEPRQLLTGIIHTLDFENVGSSLATNTAFNGPIEGGEAQTGVYGDQIIVGEFAVQNALFGNVYSLDYGSWSGWAYSNQTDNTTAGYTNGLSSFSGSGAGNSATYGVSFVDAFSPAGLPLIALPDGDTRTFDSLKLNNSTYAALSMQDGDSFAKKFGGVSGNDADWFLLTIHGKDGTGTSVGTVEFYLADYRFTDNSLDYIVDSWTDVDVSSLNAARSLEFSLTSSDNGAFGMNTPAYFAVDDILLVEPAADLNSVSFNAANDHVLNGQTDVTFTVENSGNLDAGAFTTHVVWSPNDIVGDADDVIVTASATSFPGLAAGAMTSRTVSLQLDRAALFSHSLVADPVGSGVGTVSLDSSQLFLVIDPANHVIEGNEANNARLDKGVSSDDITYFAWDKNSNGTVEPLEALGSVQSVGTADAGSDLNADGLVSPFEALSFLQRIGYIRNANVMGDAGAVTGAVQTAVPAKLTSKLKRPEQQAAPVIAAAPAFQPNQTVTAFFIDDDTTNDGLFPPATETTIAITVESNDVASIDDSFSTVDWLSVIL